jgi:hypothetical protein
MTTQTLQRNAAALLHENELQLDDDPLRWRFRRRCALIPEVDADGTVMAAITVTVNS